MKTEKELEKEDLENLKLYDDDPLSWYASKNNKNEK